MSYLKCLKSKGSGREYPLEALYVCEYDFSPLEADYDYDAIKRDFSREAIEKGPRSLWRYRPLLPIQGEPTVGLHSGFTPLIRSHRLAEALGVKELYIKDDTVCHPTWSFKDRVVSVALSRAKELGFDTVSCASTGNLGNSVSAHGAKAGLKRFIFIPHNLEKGKVLGSLIYKPNVVAVRGNYDDVNRLCSEIVSKYNWGFVNVNLRPYYAEGSKTIGFEVAEQLGWRTPQHMVVPAASGSLLTKIWKAFKEFEKLEFLESAVETKMHCAQALGCSPISKLIMEKNDVLIPVKPDTIAKSLAIGNPADGYYARDCVMGSGGSAETATDAEIQDGIKLLAETEGVFAETAGGVTVACTKKLIESGKIPRDESIVIAITGSGLKTQEAIEDVIGAPMLIDPSLKSFEQNLSSRIR